MEPMVTKRKQLLYKEFSDRLHQACDAKKIPKHGRATQVGALVGIGYKGASKWLNGDGMPDMGNATELAVKLEIDFDWLMTGRGSMTGAKAQGGGAKSMDEEVLLKKYRQLTPTDRTRYQEIGDTLASTKHVNKKADE